MYKVAVIVYIMAVKPHVAADVLVWSCGIKKGVCMRQSIVK